MWTHVYKQVLICAYMCDSHMNRNIAQILLFLGDLLMF